MAKNEEPGPGAPDSRPGPGVMKHVLWTLGASSLLVLLMFVWANNDPSMPPFLLTLPLGALGASLREFQMSLVGRTAGGGDSTYFRDASATATIARTIAGAALAALLNGLFISGMLKGFLFPDYHFKDETFDSLRTLMRSISLSTNLDAVKVMVWSLMAGYSENWVLAMLAATRQKKAQP